MILAAFVVFFPFIFLIFCGVILYEMVMNRSVLILSSEGDRVKYETTTDRNKEFASESYDREESGVGSVIASKMRRLGLIDKKKKKRIASHRMNSMATLSKGVGLISIDVKIKVLRAKISISERHNLATRSRFYTEIVIDKNELYSYRTAESEAFYDNKAHSFEPAWHTSEKVWTLFNTNPNVLQLEVYSCELSGAVRLVGSAKLPLKTVIANGRYEDNLQLWSETHGRFVGTLLLNVKVLSTTTIKHDDESQGEVLLDGYMSPLTAAVASESDDAPGATSQGVFANGVQEEKYGQGTSSDQIEVDFKSDDYTSLYSREISLDMGGTGRTQNIIQETASELQFSVDSKLPSESGDRTYSALRPTQLVVDGVRKNASEPQEDSRLSETPSPSPSWKNFNLWANAKRKSRELLSTDSNKVGGHMEGRGLLTVADYFDISESTILAKHASGIMIKMSNALFNFEVGRHLHALLYSFSD